MASVTPRPWTKPDGTIGRVWMVRYIDPATGKRPGKSFQLKKDADAFKRQVERDLEDGLHVTRSATKVMKHVIEEFIEHTETRWREGQIGESHYRRQAMVARVYIMPALANRVVRDLTIADVAKLHRSMVDKGLHPRSVKQYLNTLQMVEDFARKRGYLKTQPVADAMSDQRGIPAFRVETFKPAEVTQLLRAAPELMRGRPLRTAAFMGCAVALASLAGLRVGEILTLHTCNVDFDRRLVRVRNSITAYREMKGPKTAAGVRDVELPPTLMAMLERWRDTYHGDDAPELFFATGTGGAYTYGAVHEGWLRLLKREGLPRRHFHALRHFYTSWLLKHGMPVAEVSKMLGHSDQRITLQVYTHSLMEEAERGSHIDRIAGILMSNDAPVTHERQNA